MVKLLVVGVDGATWSVIDPLMARGQLPHFKRLRDRGASGTMQAFQYMLNSALLWTSINSGKLPEKHGIEFFGATATDVRCKRIWEVLEEQGWRVGVCGELVTWPPREVNGFLIPDLFALGPQTHPDDLQFLQEIALGEKNSESTNRRIPGAAPRQLLRYGVRPETIAASAAFLARRKLRPREQFLSWFWRKALLQPRLYTDVAVSLTKRLKLDYLSFHFHTTDTLSHRYWRYWDPTAFKNVDQNDVQGYSDVIPAAYREADRTLGRLLSLAGPETTILVVSDHGFKPIPYGQNYQYTLKLEHLMRLLELTTSNTVPARLGPENVLYLKDPARKGAAANLLSMVRIAPTDEPLFDVREGDGFVSFVLADRGRDLLGCSFTAPFGDFAFDDLFEDRGFVDSGTHHPDGIIIMAGNGIKSGQSLPPTSPLDIAPTLLALAGLPVPSDMDGRVLTEAFTEEFLERRPVTYCDSYESGDRSAHNTATEPEESDVVLERLKALGYL